MKRLTLRAAGWVILCLLCMTLTLPTAAVTRQVAVVAGKDLYIDGEQLQMQARLLPPEGDVSWVWECRLPGEEPQIVSQTDKVTLDLTPAYHGAVLCPVATLTDGTVLRGPEQTLVVERYCLGLELECLPQTCTYAPGDAFDPTGCRIVAKLSDGSRLDVTADCVWSPAVLTAEDAQVLATCVLRRNTGEPGTFGCSIPVTVAEPARPENKDPGTSSGGNEEKEDTADQQAGSGNESVPDPEQTPDASDPLRQGVAERPTWSKDSGAGIAVAVGMLALCLGMGLGAWRLIGGKRR